MLAEHGPKVVTSQKLSFFYLPQRCPVCLAVIAKVNQTCRRRGPLPSFSLSPGRFMASLQSWAMSPGAKPWICPPPPGPQVSFVKYWTLSCVLSLLLGVDAMMTARLCWPPLPHAIPAMTLVTLTLSPLSCLTPDAEARPDIVEVSSMISDVMMKYLDNLSTSQLALEKKLERERRRTQRYFMEANRNAVTCNHELALLSQVTRNLLVPYEAS